MDDGDGDGDEEHHEGGEEREYLGTEMTYVVITSNGRTVTEKRKTGLKVKQTWSTSRSLITDCLSRENGDSTVDAMQRG